MYDGVYSYDSVATNIPTAAFVDEWNTLLNLNDSFVEQIHSLSKTCGYDAFMEQSLVFPPKGPLATPPNADSSNDTCNIWEMVYEAASLVNPCFDIYQIATTCPLLWDVLGFPGSFGYVPDGAFVYFNLTDVQKAINAPIQAWDECSSIDVFVDGEDTSLPSGLSVLPGVIERTERTILGHALLDYILLYNGTLMAIQNMTWNGQQGFQQGPSTFKDFYVPYHEEYQQGSIAASGVMGKYHTERGLTLVTVELSGHMVSLLHIVLFFVSNRRKKVPQYSPSAAYRHVEYLLGRIPDLGSVSAFTTMPDTSY